MFISNTPKQIRSTYLLYISTSEQKHSAMGISYTQYMAERGSNPGKGENDL